MHPKTVTAYLLLLLYTLDRGPLFAKAKDCVEQGSEKIQECHVQCCNGQHPKSSESRDCNGWSHNNWCRQSTATKEVKRITTEPGKNQERDCKKTGSDKSQECHVQCCNGQDPKTPETRGCEGWVYKKWCRQSTATEEDHTTTTTEQREMKNETNCWTAEEDRQCYACCCEKYRCGWEKLFEKCKALEPVYGKSVRSEERDCKKTDSDKNQECHVQCCNGQDPKIPETRDCTGWSDSNWCRQSTSTDKDVAITATTMSNKNEKNCWTAEEDRQCYACCCEKYRCGWEKLSEKCKALEPVYAESVRSEGPMITTEQPENKDKISLALAILVIAVVIIALVIWIWKKCTKPKSQDLTRNGNNYQRGSAQL